MGEFVGVRPYKTAPNVALAKAHAISASLAAATPTRVPMVPRVVPRVPCVESAASMTSNRPASSVPQRPPTSTPTKRLGGLSRRARR